jgi:hypothetical protein
MYKHMMLAITHHAMMSVHLLIPGIPNSESAGGTKNEGRGPVELPLPFGRRPRPPKRYYQCAVTAKVNNGVLQVR